jgi:hypothetical protein
VIKGRDEVITERPVCCVRVMSGKPLRTIGATGQAQAMRLWCIKRLIKRVGERAQVLACRLTFACGKGKGVGKRRGERYRFRPTTAAALLPAPRDEWPQPAIWCGDERRDTRWPFELCRSDHEVICTNLSKVKRPRRGGLHGIKDQRAPFRFTPQCLKRWEILFRPKFAR